MSSALRKIAFSKSCMLTILLWVATALPVSYLKIYIASPYQLLYIALFSLAVLMLTVLPTSYFALLLKHRCPKCKGLWSYAYRGDKLLEKGRNHNGGETVYFEKILQKHSCDHCGYAKLTPKVKTIKEKI